MKDVGNGSMLKKNGIRLICSVIMVLFIAVALYGCGNSGSGAEEKSEVKIGDIIRFGRFEQNDNDADLGEEIEWIVLAVEENRALLISKYLLDLEPFNENWDSVTWDECTLRSWLNGAFVNSAFTADEKARILETSLPAGKNPEYNIDAGGDTTDSIFILSIDEVGTYLTHDAAAQVTDSAKASDYYTGPDSGYFRWWLRSPGYTVSFAAYVDGSGNVVYTGVDVDQWAVGVRPALWIEL